MACAMSQLLPLPAQISASESEHRQAVKSRVLRLVQNNQFQHHRGIPAPHTYKMNEIRGRNAAGATRRLCSSSSRASSSTVTRIVSLAFPNEKSSSIGRQASNPAPNLIV